MELYELIAPCHFGLEAVMKREILDLGYEIERVEDGKVTFLADAEGIAYANLFLRTTERILLKVGQVHAETYDELFEATKALPWEKFIPKNGKFWVTKANSIKSKLFSPSDIQSIMKKAIVERLKQVYHSDAAKILFEYTIYRASDQNIVATGTTTQVFLNTNRELELVNPAFYIEWKKKWNII